MKKTDIAMIILIASAAALIAFFVANNIPALKLSDKGEKVKTTEKIEAAVTPPDAKVFNKSSINPTVEAFIGKDT